MDKKIVNFVYPDGSEDALFSHDYNENEFDVDKGNYVAYVEDGVTITIPWHRVQEVREFGDIAHYRRSALLENGLVEWYSEDSKHDLIEIVNEMADLVERFPEFMPPTNRVPRGELEDKISKEAEIVGDEEVMISIMINLANDTGVVDVQGDGEGTLVTLDDGEEDRIEANGAEENSNNDQSED